MGTLLLLQRLWASLHVVLLFSLSLCCPVPVTHSYTV